MSSSKRIYFDNASTTPLLPEVINAITDVLQNIWGNPSSIHYEGRRANLLIEEARFSVASLIGVEPNEIFFTSSATESLNTIILGVDLTKKFNTIITTPIEHIAILNPIKRLRSTKVKFLRINEDGDIDLNNLEDILEKESKCLILTALVNNEIGNTLPLKDILNLADKYEAYVGLDCVQAIAKIPFSIKHHRILYVVGSAHKFHGPKGAAFMVIRKEGLIPPLLTGGSQERGMRAGTENTPAIWGLKKALEVALPQTTEFMRHTQELSNYILTELKQNTKVGINGGGRSRAPHILNIRFEEVFLSSQVHQELNHPIDVNSFIMWLDKEGISVSAGSACTSGANQISHVLKAIGAPAHYPHIRLSFSLLNTMEEAKTFVEIIKRRILMERSTPAVIS